MFHRVSTVLAVLFFAMMAAASAIGHVARTDPPVSQCSTGPVQCCNSIVDVNTPGVSVLLELLHVDVGSVTGQIGTGCSPLSILGAGGNSCSAQPVCCTDNNFGGLIATGCVAFNISL
ncbi:fungal hydrophobin [Coprinellus micaceus]|uniref:Hydrophobin n=1 Tax=Coprinellus micaceus TaxID=71717 RepID=A0A4Y7T3U4_COPMI|nr:fungal hydrophobin [Coprinellus micaceus]